MQSSFLTVIAPLYNIFSSSQIESLLYAFLPIRLESYKTGIYAIDTFVVTASVTLILVFLKLIVKSVDMLRPRHVNRSNEISVLVEPTHHDDYHSSKAM